MIRKIIRHLRTPLFLCLSFVLLFHLPQLMNHGLSVLQHNDNGFVQPIHNTSIAPLFTSTVQYWHEDITRWAETYDVDNNLLATVMQIESCGHPTVSSPAGAQGLFQVMPFHFSPDENMLYPETNAMRGANFLNVCMDYAGGDAGLALACYNGGPSVVQRNFHNWPDETKRYYIWGVAIYADARRNLSQSKTLEEWHNAGGIHLCRRAASELGI